MGSSKIINTSRTNRAATTMTAENSSFFLMDKRFALFLADVRFLLLLVDDRFAMAAIPHSSRDRF